MKTREKLRHNCINQNYFSVTLKKKNVDTKTLLNYVLVLFVCLPSTNSLWTDICGCRDCTNTGVDNDDADGHVYSDPNDHQDMYSDIGLARIRNCVHALLL